MASITKMLQGVSESLDGADVPDDAKEALDNALSEVKKIIAERDDYKDKIRSSEGGVSAEEAARLKRENDNLKAQVEELQGTIEQEQRKAETLDAQRKEIEAKHQELQEQIETDAKSRYLGDMLAGLGIESDAIPDERDLLMLRHEVELVRDDNGKVTGYKVDGEEPDEFSKKLRETPRIRRVIPNGNTGGGAGSTGHSTGSGEAVNPFKTGSANVTKQAELIRTDPERARMLAQEAGVRPTW